LRLPFLAAVCWDVISLMFPLGLRVSVLFRLLFSLVNLVFTPPPLLAVLDIGAQWDLSLPPSLFDSGVPLIGPSRLLFFRDLSSLPLNRFSVVEFFLVFGFPPLYFFPPCLFFFGGFYVETFPNDPLSFLDSPHRLNLSDYLGGGLLF